MFAYIDPNTGGMLFQLLAAALAVFSGVALVFSGKIRSLFARTKRSLRGEEPQEQEIVIAQNPSENNDKNQE